MTARVVEQLPGTADSYYQLVVKRKTAALGDVIAARRSLKRLIGTVRIERDDAHETNLDGSG